MENTRESGNCRTVVLRILLQALPANVCIVFSCMLFFLLSYINSRLKFCTFLYFRKLEHIVLVHYREVKEVFLAMTYVLHLSVFLFLYFCVDVYALYVILVHEDCVTICFIEF